MAVFPVAVVDDVEIVAVDVVAAVFEFVVSEAVALVAVFRLFSAYRAQYYYKNLF